MKCWICKRTSDEVKKDYDDIWEKHMKDLEEDGILSDLIYELTTDEELLTLVALRNILDSKLPICDICNETIHAMAISTVKSDTRVRFVHCLNGTIKS